MCLFCPLARLSVAYMADFYLIYLCLHIDEWIEHYLKEQSINKNIENA